MNRMPFENEEIYHVYNRGVDKRDIFMDDKDRYRFIHDLYEFNDIEPAVNVDNRANQQKLSTIEVTPRYIKKTRKLLVEILTFCLMDNHYHLMIRQMVDNGITTFMRKLGTGYSCYFNTKQKRSGTLFQGTFKSVHLERQAHFLYLPHYIHLNPTEIVGDSLDALQNYKWSSLPDYLGIKNFPSVTQRKFLLDIYNGTNGYRKDLSAWTQNSSISDMGEITLDSLN